VCRIRQFAQGLPHFSETLNETFSCADTPYGIWKENSTLVMAVSASRVAPLAALSDEGHEVQDKCKRFVLNTILTLEKPKHRRKFVTIRRKWEGNIFLGSWFRAS
jgi:hypothetical protein